MTDRHKLEYHIEAKEKASRKLRKLRAEFNKLGGKPLLNAQNQIRKYERGINRLTGTTSKASLANSRFTKGIALGNLYAMAGAKAIGLLGSAFGALKEATLVSARVEVLGKVFEFTGKNAGYTGKQIAYAKQAIQDLGIAEKEALMIGQRFIQSQLNLADATKIARIAQDAAVIAGVNSSEAALQMTDAVNKLSPRLLKQFGIMVDLNTAYKDYSKETGIATTAMTAQEKKQALLNAIIKQGATIAGAYETAMGEVGKQLTSLPRYVQDLQIAIGKYLLPYLQAIVSTATIVLKSLTMAFSTNIQKDVEETGSGIESLNKFLDDMKNDLVPVAMGLKGVGLMIKAVYESAKLAVSPLKSMGHAFASLKEFASGDIIEGYIQMGLIGETLTDQWDKVTESFNKAGLAFAYADMPAHMRDYLLGLQNTKAEVVDLDKITEATGMRARVNWEEQAKIVTAKYNPGMVDLVNNFKFADKEGNILFADSKKGMEQFIMATAELNPFIAQMAHYLKWGRVEVLQMTKTGTAGMKNYTVAVNKALDAVKDLVDYLKNNKFTLGGLLQTIAPFVPGTGGKMLGIFGSVLPFDDPVNDSRLRKETRRIGALMARGLAESMPGRGPSGDTRIINNYITIQTQRVDALELAEDLEDLSEVGFFKLGGN